MFPEVIFKNGFLGTQPKYNKILLEVHTPVFIYTIYSPSSPVFTAKGRKGGERRHLREAASQPTTAAAARGARL